MTITTQVTSLPDAAASIDSIAEQHSKLGNACMLRDDLERGLGHAVKTKKLTLVEAPTMPPVTKGGKSKNRA